MRIVLYTLAIFGAYSLAPVFAQSVYFDFTAECESDTLGCSAIALNEGDSITGYIAFSQESFDEKDGQRTEVTDFHLSAGDLQMDLGNLLGGYVTPRIQNAQISVIPFGSSIDAINGMVPGGANDFYFEKSDVDDETAFLRSASLGQINLSNLSPLTHRNPPPPVSFEGIDFVFYTLTENFDRDRIFNLASSWDVVGNGSSQTFSDGEDQYEGPWAEKFDQLEIGPDGRLYLVGSNLGMPVIRSYDMANGEEFSLYSSGFNPGDPWSVRDLSFAQDGSLLISSGTNDLQSGLSPNYRLVTRIDQNSGEVTGSFQVGLGDFPYNPDFSSLTVLEDGTTYLASVVEGEAKIVKIDLAASFASGNVSVIETVSTGVVGDLTFGQDGLLYVVSGGVTRIDLTTGVAEPFITESLYDFEIVNGRFFGLRGRTLVEYDPATGDRLWAVVQPYQRRLVNFTVISTVPEPATSWLLAFACVGMLKERKRRR